jgi:hypothetical protein
MMEKEWIHRCLHMRYEYSILINIFCRKSKGGLQKNDPSKKNIKNYFLARLRVSKNALKYLLDTNEVVVWDKIYLEHIQQ